MGNVYRYVVQLTLALPENYLAHSEAKLEFVCRVFLLLQHKVTRLFFTAKNASPDLQLMLVLLVNLVLYSQSF